MKNLFITSLVILAFCYSTFASLRVIPLNELVKDSDLIVVGTLQSVSEYSDGTVRTGTGGILVEQVVAGFDSVKTIDGLPLKSGAQLNLVWREGFSCIYGFHKRTENQKGVWFLKIETDGSVLAGHPARFKPLDEMNEIRNALKQAKLPEKVSEVRIQPQLPQPAAENIKTVDVAGRKYSALNASLVVLASLFLYYFLYRSRFKIR